MPHSGGTLLDQWHLGISLVTIMLGWELSFQRNSPNDCWYTFTHITRDTYHIAQGAIHAKPPRTAVDTEDPSPVYTNAFTWRPPWTLCGPPAWLGLPRPKLPGSISHLPVTALVHPGLCPGAWTYESSLNDCGSQGSGLWSFCFT